MRLIARLTGNYNAARVSLQLYLLDLITPYSVQAACRTNQDLLTRQRQIQLQNRFVVLREVDPGMDQIVRKARRCLSSSLRKIPDICRYMCSAAWTDVKMPVQQDFISNALRKATAELILCFQQAFRSLRIESQYPLPKNKSFMQEALFPMICLISHRSLPFHPQYRKINETKMSH